MAGFKDGPTGVNLFNYPMSLCKYRIVRLMKALDPLGNLFVLDSGNQYLRMISPDGIVDFFRIIFF